jgi:hypothetical protein
VHSGVVCSNDDTRENDSGTIQELPDKVRPYPAALFFV